MTSFNIIGTLQNKNYYYLNFANEEFVTHNVEEFAKGTQLIGDSTGI